MLVPEEAFLTYLPTKSALMWLESCDPSLVPWLADMDGLLLNTETFYTIVQKKILAEYGHTFTWALKIRLYRSLHISWLSAIAFCLDQAPICQITMAM